MIEFAIVTKNDEISQAKADEIRQLLTAHKCQENPDNPHYVITVGGDGTMLRAVHQYLHVSDTVQFVGVHTGTLGFYTNYLASDVQQMCHDLTSIKPSYNEFALLEVLIEDMGIFYALNELRLENVFHTQTIEMYMNGEYLQTFKGNGVCISTSIGSTGYNRSLGGPIVELSLPLIIMTEIAGIHHREHRSLGSPLVMGQDTTFKMVLSNSSKTLIGLDHMTLKPKGNMVVTCRLSKKTIKLAQFDGIPYQRRLHRAFIE